MGKSFAFCLKGFLLFSFLIFLWIPLKAQEARIFTTADYSLEGPVKSCLVLTNYGREEFEFNQEGYLTKAVTRYNDRDYSITYYKYDDGLLVERRDEVYRDGEFDANSSIAHFFDHDSLPSRRITEQIVNYGKEFLDRYEYYYDETGNLIRILRSSNEGVDETRIEYSQQKGESTTAYFLNEVLQKTVRESETVKPDQTIQKTVLTKEFINGAPDKAKEIVYNDKGKVLSEVEFDYSTSGKTFIPVKTTTYVYGENGMPSVVTSRENGQTYTSNYLFQFDANGNWIKQVVTPDNTYTTRRIHYFPKADKPESGQ